MRKNLYTLKGYHTLIHVYQYLSIESLPCTLFTQNFHPFSFSQIAHKDSYIGKLSQYSFAEKSSIQAILTNRCLKRIVTKPFPKMFFLTNIYSHRANASMQENNITTPVNATIAANQSSYQDPREIFLYQH